MDIKFAFYSFVSLIAIINPIGAVPVYLTLVPDQQAANVNYIALVACLSMFITLFLFQIFGQHVLDFFSISLESFRVGGGILLLLMAISMLHGRSSDVHQTWEEVSEGTTRETIAVVPLAIPMLSGPGAVGTIIILSKQAATWSQNVSLFLVLVACAVCVYGVLRLARPLNRLLGVAGTNIATRIMGLILAAVAVEFITDGLRALLPGLAGR